LAVVVRLRSMRQCTGMDTGCKDKRLGPDHYRNRDFFVADIFDFAPKDDTKSMEHPMFALSKNKDTKQRAGGDSRCRLAN
jgi:hypothetical protein